jgi:starvation-inducible DNA-binding protein
MITAFCSWLSDLACVVSIKSISCRGEAQATVDHHIWRTASAPQIDKPISLPRLEIILKGMTMQSYKTHNDVSSNAKSISIGVLNARLADSIDLALLTKQAHWNIKGPQFIALHEMIDGFRTELDEHVDTMAERVVQLGGTALGTTQTVAESTTLAPYPTDIYAADDHLGALIERYAKVASAVRAAIDETDNAGDADTADLFTAFSRALDKSLWFLEAHRQ